MLQSKKRQENILKNFKRNINFNKIVANYIICTSIIYALFLVTPFRVLIRDNFLYSLQTYLGVVGIFIILSDLILYRNIFKNKFSFLLYGIVALAILASFRTLNYGGLKDNIFNIAWFSIYVAVFFNNLTLMSRENREKTIKYILSIVTFVYSITCLLSLLTFILNLGFYIDIDPAPFNALTRQGFLENRLFGIFTSINLAAAACSVIMLLNVQNILGTKKVSVRIYYGISSLLLLSFIVLSGSRSARLSLIISLSFVAIIYIIRKDKLKGVLVKAAASILAILIVTISIILVFRASSWIYVKTSNLIRIQFGLSEKLEEFNNTLDNLTDSRDDDEEISVDRTDTERISNNRFEIWKDYISLYKEIGLIGLSPENYSEYLQVKAPNTYVVEHVREHYPGIYKDGGIYHPHNGYIMTYVSTGFLGLGLLIIFLILCLKELIQYIFDTSNIIDLKFYSIVLTLVFILTNIMFDQGVIFRNDFLSSMFWLSAGYFMSYVKTGGRHE